MQENNQIVVLDIEGTIVTYDFTKKPDKKGDYSPQINPKLSGSLQKLKNLNFLIVINSGTNKEGLNTYKVIFGKCCPKLEKLIDAWEPEENQNIIKAEKDGYSKVQKLDLYCSQYKIQDKKNLYFFDDAEKNIQTAVENGYKNSFYVNEKQTLIMGLEKIYNDIKLEKIQGSGLFQTIKQTENCSRKRHEDSNNPKQSPFK